MATGAALLGAACEEGTREDPTAASTPASARADDPNPAARDTMVIAGGPLTEIVFALGAGARVVGVDTSSTFPADVERLPKVGYQRQLAAEGIVSLAPGMLLASEEAGPPAVLERLKQVGVRVSTIAGPKDPAGIARRVRDVGAAIGKATEADTLASVLDAEVGALLEAARARSTRPRVLFLYARGQGTMMVGGKGTTADVVLELAGLTNAAEKVRGFEPLSAEAVVEARPDLFLVPAKGLASLGGVDGLFALPGMAQTPAAGSKRAMAVDDLLLLGLGPRTGTAIGQISREVHGA
jgi:iron complex transport system substrate-binding protein